MQPSRREFLTSILGAAVMSELSACTGRTSPPLPPGAIVGASVERGHRLKDGGPALGEVPRERFRQHDVVIVGGGVAGLAAAWRLSRAGFADYTLLELEAELGGTARGGEARASAHPWGAHYVNAPMAHDRAMVALLDEMGVLEGKDSAGEPIVAEQFLCREPEERIYYRGRWYEGLYLRAGASKDDIAELQRFERMMGAWADWRDSRGRRAFTIPMALASDDSHVTALDRVSMAAWLAENGFRSERLRWLVDYACRDDYGSRPDETSAWAGIFYFTARLKRSGVETQPVVTWPEGNGHLVAHLSRAVGTRAQSGVLISALRKVEGGIDVVGQDGDSAAFGVHTKRVICATPQFVTRRLLAGSGLDASGQAQAARASFEYSPWLVANLSLTGRPSGRGFPLAWDNVFYDSPSLGYVVATHQRGIDRGPTVLTYYLPLAAEAPRAAREKLLATGRDAWAEAALADIGRAHPEVRGLCERLDVMRWGHAMVRPRPSFIWGGARQKAAEALPGVCFAHSDLSGVALFEEALHHGVKAAEDTLAALGRPVRESLL